MSAANAAVVVGVGAREGLGAALARRLGAENLHVVDAGRTAQKLEACAEEVRSASQRVGPRGRSAAVEGELLSGHRAAGSWSEYSFIAASSASAGTRHARRTRRDTHRQPSEGCQ